MHWFLFSPLHSSKLWSDQSVQVQNFLQFSLPGNQDYSPRTQKETIHVHENFAPSYLSHDDSHIYLKNSAKVYNKDFGIKGSLRMYVSYQRTLLIDFILSCFEENFIQISKKRIFQSDIKNHYTKLFVRKAEKFVRTFWTLLAAPIWAVLGLFDIFLTFLFDAFFNTLNLLYLVVMLTFHQIACRHSKFLSSFNSRNLHSSIKALIAFPRSWWDLAKHSIAQKVVGILLSWQICQDLASTAITIPTIQAFGILAFLWRSSISLQITFKR